MPHKWHIIYDMNNGEERQKQLTKHAANYPKAGNNIS